MVALFRACLVSPDIKASRAKMVAQNLQDLLWGEWALLPVAAWHCTRETTAALPHPLASGSVAVSCNTKQVLLCSQKDLAVADGRRSVAAFAERVLADQLKLSARSDDSCHAGIG